MKRAGNFDMLFTEPYPTLRGFKRHAEGDFSYMNSHADSPVLGARKVLEEWYENYPTDHREDLASRFRSRNKKQHSAAFWELYLHELCRRLGYEVQVHPIVAGSDARPDFLLAKEGMPVAYVEARLAGLESDQVTSAKRLEEELHDALDRIDSPNFFLQIEKIKTASVRPSFKQLTKDVEAWLSTLDPDSQMKLLLEDRKKTSRFRWEANGWFLSLRIIPKSPEYRGQTGGRSVGVFSIEAQWLDTRGELRRALIEKAGKYGDLDIPLVIAINHMGMHCDRTDWMDALFGSQAVTVWFDEDGNHFQKPFRKNDGFWIRKGAPLRTHVSAVVGGWCINPWSMGAHALEVYRHFAPIQGFSFQNELPRWVVSQATGELELHRGRSSAEILNIPLDWPGDWDVPSDR